MIEKARKVVFACELKDASVLSRRDWLLGLSILGLGSLADSCLASPAPLWLDQRQVGSFVFRSTFMLSDAETIDVGLVDLEAELRRILSLRSGKQTVEVLLFDTEAQYRSIVSIRHPEISDIRACFVQQGDLATIYTYKQPSLAIDLRHECTHALLHADLPKLPLWLDEGLAEYFEPPKSERAVGDAHLKRLLEELDSSRMIQLVELEKEIEFESFSGRDYRFAWAWVHFLLHGPEEASQTLWKYLGELRLRKETLPLSNLLSKTCSHYQDQFVAHFRNWPDVVHDSKAE